MFVLYAWVCACAHVCMCGACICWRWNPGLQTNMLQTEPHPQPSLIPLILALLIPCWTLRSPRPLMIKYLVQCLLHPVASSSEGFGSQDAGRQMGAQALSLLSRLHVWGADSAQGQCLLWLPPICDFALGTSGVPYPVTGRIKDTQPQWTRELQQILTQGAGTHVTAHTETEGWHSASDTMCPTQRQPATWELVCIFG